jgi:hypothetical protein
MADVNDWTQVDAGLDLPSNFFNLMPTSRSGMDYGSPIWQGIGPQMLNLGADMPNMIDQYTEQAYGNYNNMMRNALGKQGSLLQGNLNELNNRGILNSSVAGDVLSKASVPLLQGIGDKAWQTGMGAAKMQMGVPALLADIANTARISRSSGSSTSTSQTTDPLAPYNSYMNWVLRGAGM